MNEASMNFDAGPTTQMIVGAAMGLSRGART